MNLENASAIVTGGASGLGLACVRQLARKGAAVVAVDLSSGASAEVVAEFGDRVRCVAADVCDTYAMNAACDVAENLAPLRVLINCAGVGGTIRIVDREGNPGSLEAYQRIVQVNLIGTFNSLRLVAARMVRNAPVLGERGVCVLTASVAAFEGQIGQIGYSASKGGVAAMTLVAARDLAQRQIRVCTIAPGLFDTPLLAKVPEAARASLAASVPHPSRLGMPDEYAGMAMHIVENAMLNGETIRLDGAIRMAPR